MEQTLHQIRAALISGSDSGLQEGLRTLLSRHVSSLDISKDHRQYAYHMLLLGLFLPLMGHYSVTSNAESGDGRYDICLSPRRRMDPGIVIEIKWEADASDDRLKELASEALRQIDEHNYKANLQRDGVSRILKFGGGFLCEAGTGCFCGGQAREGRERSIAAWSFDVQAKSLLTIFAVRIDVRSRSPCVVRFELARHVPLAPLEGPNALANRNVSIHIDAACSRWID